LWRREPHLLTKLQTDVQEAVLRELPVDNVHWSDPYEADRQPLAVLRRLTG
jgi:DEAD/DEAH box helicase domain-containing protein